MMLASHGYESEIKLHMAVAWPDSSGSQDRAPGLHHCLLFLCLLQAQLLLSPPFYLPDALLPPGFVPLCLSWSSAFCQPCSHPGLRP